MTRPRSVLLLGIPVLIGAGLALWWVRTAGGSTLLRGLSEANPALVLLALGATAGWLFARFIRWQFLLRRVGARLPIRTTLGTYVAGLPGTATPAYVGEAVRGLFIKRRFGVPMRVSLAVLVFERLYDVAALALVTVGAGLVAGGDARALQVGAVFFALAVAGGVMLWPVGRRIGIRDDAMTRLRSAATIGPALALSVLAWATAALLIAITARALGISLGAAEGARVFGTSTLLGAVTLLPAGVGATGSLAILELSRLGLDTSAAVLVVSLFRLTSTGAALTVGAVFLWRELRDANRGATRPAEGTAHFDQIAEQYNAQWSPHVWDLLLDRKLGFMADALPTPPAAAGVGLDLGCGLGLQTAELRKRGYQVIGLDPSVGLLAVGQQRLGPSPVIAGSALELPFPDQSLDFVYTIGVLHHLPGRDAQRDALGEITRVLKPGGTFLVHESNPRNPLFRFYMGYLFPILKRIDEGTEWWIDPRTWQTTNGLRLEGVRYFTFLPDFTPRLMMTAAVAVERLLERGPTRAYSAHYMAVLRRPGLPEGETVHGARNGAFSNSSPLESRDT
ncbi:MAG: lysylphosphatidylglycerol synthase domain-containing protein [Gemmatimonadaceae bacterium]